MSGTELVRAPTSYSDIAALQGRRSLLYREFGSYQGEWLMLALGDEYAIYKGWYGSCSGCDDLQATFSYEDDVQVAKVNEWVESYRPFALLPRSTAANLATRKTLATVFPKNIREGEVQIEEFAQEAELIIALEERLDLTVDDALASRNQETRRRIFEHIGISAVITDEIATEESGPDRLVRLADDGVYLHLHDPSTDREYLLRVPPDTRSVRSGKAWSFGLTSKQYKPRIET